MKFFQNKCSGSIAAVAYYKIFFFNSIFLLISRYFSLERYTQIQSTIVKQVEYFYNLLSGIF